MTRKAIVNIFSSYNNVLLTATDLTGAETIAKCSGGQVVKSSKDSGGPFAATRAAEMLADMLKEKEFTQLIIRYRAPGGNKSTSAGPGAQAAGFPGLATMMLARGRAKNRDEQQAHTARKRFSGVDSLSAPSV